MKSKVIVGRFLDGLKYALDAWLGVRLSLWRIVLPSSGLQRETSLVNRFSVMIGNA